MPREVMPQDMSHYRRRGHDLIREAGRSIGAWLEADPRTIDDATPLELDVVERALGKTFMKRVSNRAGQHAKAEREAQRAAKPRAPYPAFNRSNPDW